MRTYDDSVQVFLKVSGSLWQQVALKNGFPGKRELLKYVYVKLLDHARPESLSTRSVLAFVEGCPKAFSCQEAWIALENAFKLLHLVMGEDELALPLTIKTCTRIVPKR